MHEETPTLHILCGKIASGKSTLAAQLSAKPDTVLITEDAWLDALFSEELQTREDYVRCSRRIKAAMKPHILALLRAGVSVVLDFPANTSGQRRWFREIIETTGAAHTLHVLDVSEEVCMARLRARNVAGDHPFVVTDDLFHEVTSYFTAPSAEKGSRSFAMAKPAKTWPSRRDDDGPHAHAIPGTRDVHVVENLPFKIWVPTPPHWRAPS